MNRFLIISLLITALLSSCKKDDPPVNKREVTPEMAKDSLYYIMNYFYYWYNVMPVVDKNNYYDPYTLLEAMRYRPVDKWSFVEDYDTFIAEMEGDFVGHGIRISIDESDKARIAMIYSRSPLYALGVRRGWIIKSINNADISQIIISKDDEAYERVLGESKEGVTNKFVFERPDGSEVTISSTKTKFKVNSVLLYDTLHLSSGITGHLVFESFIEPSSDELVEAFAFFKSANIKDLIIDLRYNSGGYLFIAQRLASYIAGSIPSPANAPFVKLIYNDKNQNQNSLFSFETTNYPLSLTRLAVITSRSTASASEAVMNGLNPFINVVSLGDTTAGKPMGMNGWPVGQKYFFWPVTFKTVNYSDNGDYFDGIPPSKYIIDDITHDFDDRDELCLKEAIHFLETGSLSTKSIYKFRRQKHYSEKPSWVNNGLTILK